MVPPTEGGSPSQSAARGRAHAQELFWNTLGRLVLFYFIPLLLLAVFFHIQYRHLVQESLEAHLEVIAEHQANTFDLFIRERLANLGNVLDDPDFEVVVGSETLAPFLQRLQHTSDAFLDLGVVNASGELTAYLGPVRYQASVNYRGEDWFRALLAPESSSVITEIYLGFRDQPHFTIAVRRGTGPETRILRAALSPERMAWYLTTLEGANEVHAAIVNRRGILQVATPAMGEALQPSAFIPPTGSDRGLVARSRLTDRPAYAYSHLSETPWSLVVVNAATGPPQTLNLPNNFSQATFGIFLLVGVVILVRTRQVVGSQIAAEEHEANLSGQLVHAAKLASVGELAAGIAHEINNPLAIIAEEVGVLRDTLDPELPHDEGEILDLPDHLQAIHDAVFRCRDITRKLLTFVRQREVHLDLYSLNEILDEVLEVILGNELSISNVNLERVFDSTLPRVFTDRNQIIQVFVNMVKNAIDAMPAGGHLKVSTRVRSGNVSVAFRDTGTGIPPEDLHRVFMPFFTTKDPGKGTGLGLSVSSTIVRNLGGECYVDSTPGEGSIFTVELPLSEGWEDHPRETE